FTSFTGPTILMEVVIFFMICCFCSCNSLLLPVLLTSFLPAPASRVREGGGLRSSWRRFGLRRFAVLAHKKPPRAVGFHAERQRPSPALWLLSGPFLKYRGRDLRQSLPGFCGRCYSLICSFLLSACPIPSGL